MEGTIFKREIINHILPYIGSKEAIVIYGTRQVGKTSLLHYLATHYLTNVFYLDMEFRNLLELCNQGPEAVQKYLLEKGADQHKKAYLIIDEIQYLADPTNFIKLIVDHYKNIKLIVSGSSTFEIKRKFKESLTGRTISFTLYPLTFEEFLIFRKKKYQLTAQNSKTLNDELIPLAEEFIRFGGYPQIVLEASEEKKKAYLYQIIDTYVRKDIRNIGNIKNISQFNKLLEILAAQSGNLLNVLELSNTLGISRVTATEYLQLLENTFIIKHITPYHKNIRAELSKQPKLFFLDTGMMHLLWLKEFPKTILGNVFETFVFLELMKSGETIHFWRTTTQHEVDFIITNKKIHAIEAKYDFNQASQKNLKKFAGQYPCKTIIVALKGEKKGKYVWELIKEMTSKNR